jgi:hypothetical protein
MASILFLWVIVISIIFLGESTPVRHSSGPSPPPGLSPPAISALQVWQWREESRGMISHAYTSYMRHAYPADELKPLSCEGRAWDKRERGTLDDCLGGYALTLVDSLSTLALVRLSRSECSTRVNAYSMMSPMCMLCRLATCLHFDAASLES